MANSSYYKVDTDTYYYIDSAGRKMLAPDYTDLDYPVSAGQHCVYDNKLYRAKQAIASSETWNAGHWDEVVLTDEVARIQDEIGDLNDLETTAKTDLVSAINDVADAAVVNMGVLPSGTDLNSVTGNVIYGLGSQQTYTNKPDIESGFLHSFKFSDGFGSQIAHELNGSKVYARLLLSGSWSAWARIDTPRALQVYDHLGVVMPSVDDLDDIKETGMWGISSQISYAHCPIPSSGWLECYQFQASPVIYVQRVWSLFDTASFARYYINGTWSAWVSRDGRDINNVYYAFGDSTTYGQIGGGSGQSPYNYPACVGTLLKMTVKNKGVGNQGLIKDWDTIHTNFINGLDMSDAALISVGWAYNDGGQYAGINFGDYDDTGSTTFIGKYFTIMKEFQQKCPTAHVILITGYGHPNGTVSPMTKPTLEDQFTHNYTFADGPRTVMEMYDTLEAMCHLHGWSCVNQAKGTCFNQWNANSMIGDQIHPTNDGYIAYGNMIAARVSALWANLY